MVRKEWGTIVKQIRAFYPKYDFMEREDSFDAWYELLEDLEYPATLQAVKNLAKENQYPPTIADIRHEYQRMLDIFNNRLREVKHNYRNAMSGYPFFEYDDDTYNVFLNKIKKIPQAQWVNVSRKFASNTIAFVRDCELNDKPIPNYKDYINEQSF